MIFESSYWKDDLKRRATWFQAKKRQRRWSDRSLFLAEHSFMVAGYSVRKLLEGHKLSDQVAASKVRVGQLPFSGTRLHIFNRHDIERHYDFSREKRTTIALRDLSNVIVHSYVFVTLIGERGGLYGFVVSSDWKKDKWAYVIRTDEWVRTLKRVASDYPSKSNAVWNDRRGDYDITAS